ncbi:MULTISPECIES: Cdc6/Cdc18 family protein [Halorussus]|uniref:Cdc6/Cdc18 family protein n=1 Tax=Halorussus TaxID=1070314 RepID=UPI00209D9B41|nr:AAA family ATPase [Halorussus vallis]USZ77570.1 AAA family ATPase [Halorussus vallis]
MFDNTSTSSGIIYSERYLNGEASLQPTGRDKEIHAIRDGVRPLIKRNTPETLLVYGTPGTGKTVCVNHVFGALDRETSVKTIQINCWQYSTRPALLTELLIQLGYPAPRKGKPVDELLSKLREWLQKNRSVAVSLDEFDQLQDKTEVAYDLYMLSQQTENKLGLIMISNLPPDELLLDSRSWSRLNCRTIEFEPYTAGQLEEILQDVVEQAFKSGTVNSEVIEAIAEQVADNTGDCRQAFEQLLQAGRRATQNGARKITEQDLAKVDD